MDETTQLLDALADAARTGRKAEFDRLERELLTRFDGSFDAMPPDVYAKYLEVDRLWPVVAPPPDGSVSPNRAALRRNALQVSLAARDEAWLRELGATSDRSVSAVLAACLAVLRGDETLRDAVVQHLDRPARDHPTDRD